MKALKYSQEELDLILEEEMKKIRPAKKSQPPRQRIEWTFWFFVLCGALIVALGIYGILAAVRKRNERDERITKILSNHSFHVVAIRELGYNCNLSDGHLYEIRYGCKDLVTICEQKLCCNSESCFNTDGGAPVPVNNSED